MPRYKPKRISSQHGKQRFSQRYDGEGSPEIMASKALHYGIHYSQIPEGLNLKKFVFEKKLRNDKKIRLVDGYVVVLSRSGRLITLYRLPDEYQAEYESIKSIQDENRDWYRSMKRSGQ